MRTISSVVISYTMQLNKYKTMKHFKDPWHMTTIDLQHLLQYTRVRIYYASQSGNPWNACTMMDNNT